MFFLVQFSFLVFLGPLGCVASKYCKCAPGNSCWPSDADFSSLNSTLSGRLIRGIPPGSVCYTDQPNFDESACEQVRANWFSAAFHADYAISIGFPYWADNPCPPIFPNGTSVTGDPDAGKKGCSIGRYPAYVVNASGHEDIQAAFKFASKRGLRVNVKNTGLSLQGRSTAFGSLSIWTYHIKGVQFHDAFEADRCPSAGSHAAASIAAGEKVRALYEATNARKLVVVAGQCENVGVMGWLQGGGHGPLSSSYGMGVDNVLQIKIVTPDGNFLTANACQNTDLFWSIRGGGGGTFGVVTEVTMKAYPHPDITAHALTVAALPSANESSYWNLAAEIHSHLPSLKQGGLQGYVIMTPSTFSPTETNTLTWSFSIYDAPQGKVESLIAPVLALLDTYNNTLIAYTSNITKPSTFLGYWLSTVGPEPVANAAVSSGSRLLPAPVFSSDAASISRFANTLQRISAPPAGLSPPVLQSHMIANSANRGLNISLVPAWRDAVVHFVIVEGFADSSSLEEAKVVYARQTERTALLKALAPVSGAYLNEGDPFDPEWQVDFWGRNYNGLRRVKRKVDPETSLWCLSCVGGEGWVNQADGRLCQV